MHFTYSNQRCSDAPSDDKGKCSKGAMCPMAHNDCEHFYHPDFVRKSVCMYADNPSQCKGPLCSFMHPAEMMRRDFTEYQNMKGNKEASRQESLPPARAPAPPREFDAVPTWGEGKDEWPTALNSSRGASSQKATSQPSQGDAFQTFQSEASQVSLGSQLSEHSQPNSFDPVHDSSGSALTPALLEAAPLELREALELWVGLRQWRQLVTLRLRWALAHTSVCSTPLAVA